jgi:hypothetical protein
MRSRAICAMVAVSAVVALSPRPAAAQRVGILFDGIGPPLDEAVVDAFGAAPYYRVVRFDEPVPAKGRKAPARLRAALQRKRRAAEKAFTAFKLPKARNHLSDVIDSGWQNPTLLTDVTLAVDVLMLWGAIELMLGRAEAAEAPLRQALALDPDVDPDAAVFTPEMREQFSRIRGQGPAGGTGSLAIDSEPGGASVFVDGRFAGSAPARVDGLFPGRHIVRVERAGHASWAGAPAVAAGGRVEVLASLEPIAGFQAYQAIAAEVAELDGPGAELSEAARAAAVALEIDQVIVARKVGATVRVDQYGVATGKHTGVATAQIGEAGDDARALRAALGLLPSQLLPRGGRLGAGAILARNVKARDVNAFKKELSIAMAPREAAIVYSDAVVPRRCFEAPACVASEAGLLEVEALLDLQLGRRGKTLELRSRLYAGADGRLLGVGAEPVLDVVSSEDSALRVAVGRWLALLVEAGIVEPSGPTVAQIEASGEAAARTVAGGTLAKTAGEPRTGYVISGSVLGLVGAGLAVGGYFYWQTWRDARFDPLSTQDTLDRADRRATIGIAGAGIGAAAFVTGLVLLLYGAGGS